MTEIYDDAGLSRRDRAKLVAELMAKAGEVKAGPDRRVRALFLFGTSLLFHIQF